MIFSRYALGESVCVCVCVCAYVHAPTAKKEALAIVMFLAGVRRFVKASIIE